MQDYILQIMVNTRLRHCLDYLPPADYPLECLRPGIRIQVPFRQQKKIGILWDIKPISHAQTKALKTAFAPLDTEPVLPEPILKLIHWISDYYHYPIGDIALYALPRLLRQGRTLKPTPVLPALPIKPMVLPPLNPQQRQAVKAIINALGAFHTMLLYGITGSGKTTVYLSAIHEYLKRGLQALILVPEIGLTPQTAQHFSQYLGITPIILHSALSEKERLTAWLNAASGEAQIVIGTRSALFTPMPRLGIIIIDEEHDLSFKQQDKLRYSARDVALMRGKFSHIPVVLSSATPSLETLYNVEKKRFQCLQLSERAGYALQPRFTLLDLRNQVLHQGISNSLLKAITQHIDAGNQVLLFLNRRGYAPILLCHACGWIARCRRCDASLVLHHNPERLQCHHCGIQQMLFTKCELCHATDLLPIGLGTQRLEVLLKQYFPDIEIIRIDKDNTRRKGTLQQILSHVQSGRRQILIGTQMLAKGHHFPNVTLVAILDADHGLFSADFRANERIAQLLIQVAGRAGRADKPGEVIIQTHMPEHPLLLKLIYEGYLAFAHSALLERKQVKLPPYCYLALFRAEASKQGLPHQFLGLIAEIANELAIPKIQILGPIPAPMEKRDGRFRAQLLIQSSQRKPLHQVVKTLILQIEKHRLASKVRWSLDIDPQEMF